MELLAEPPKFIGTDRLSVSLWRIRDLAPCVLTVF